MCFSPSFASLQLITLPSASYSSKWYRKSQQGFWEGARQVSQLLLVILCFCYSLSGLKLGPYSGGEAGSLINGWMFEWLLSSSLGVMECETAFCSSTTCIMRKRRCVHLTKCDPSLTFDKRKFMNTKERVEWLGGRTFS